MALTDNLVPMAKNLFWVKAPGKGRFPYCNGFLITGAQTVLIDAGMGEEIIREIDNFQRIDFLLISHSHPDHVLYWHLLQDRHIMMPQETPDGITDLLELGLRFTGSEEKAVHWKKRIGDGFGLQALREPDARYSDEQVFDFGGVRIKAIHAPGHLEDHYCFLVDDSVLLTTDIDFDSFGPWYGNPECDIKQFKESIQKVRTIPCNLVCSSHRPPIASADSQQAFDEYLAHFDRQQKAVLDLCEQPISLDELVNKSPIYWDKLPDKNVQKIFETNIVQKILDQAAEAGLVKEDNGLWMAS